MNQPTQPPRPLRVGYRGPPRKLSRAERIQAEEWNAVDAGLAARGTVKKLALSLAFVGYMGYVWATTTYSLPIGDVAVAMGLVGLIFQSGKLRLPLWTVWFGLFLVWAWSGIFVSPYPEVVKLNVLALAKVWLITILACNAIRSRAHVRVFMTFWVAAFAMYPIRGSIFNRLLYGETLNGRAIWNHIYQNPNDLAVLTLLLLSVAVALAALEPKGWFRTGALASIVVFPTVILLTQSRGSLLGLMAFAILAVPGQRMKARQIGFAAMIVGTILISVPSSAWERLSQVGSLAPNTGQLGQLDDRGSAAQRFEIWGIATAIFQEEVATGVGWGGYELAHWEYWRAHRNEIETAGGARDAHSLPLSILAETGLIGFLFWLLMLSSVFVFAETRRREARPYMPRGARQIQVLQAGIVGVLVAGLFGSYQDLAFLYLGLALLWAVAALVSAEVEALRRSGRPPPNRGRRRRAGVPRRSTPAPAPAPALIHAP